MTEWMVENLNHGQTRMRREVNDNLVLLVGDDHWVAYDPTDGGPSLKVGTISKSGSTVVDRTEGMQAADQWVAENVGTWHVTNEFEIGDDGFCKVYASFTLKESADQYVIQAALDGDPEAGITPAMVAQGFISIRAEMPRIEDIPWLVTHIPSDEEAQASLADLDRIDKELA